MTSRCSDSSKFVAATDEQIWKNFDYLGEMQGQVHPDELAALREEVRALQEAVRVNTEAVRVVTEVVRAPLQDPCGLS